MERTRPAVLQTSAAIAGFGVGCLDGGIRQRAGAERIAWFEETRSLVDNFVVTDQLLFALTPHHLIALTHDGEREWEQQFDEFDDALDYGEGITADEEYVYVSGTPGTTAYDHDGGAVTDELRTRVRDGRYSLSFEAV